MKIRAILFDLDGTLIDQFVAIHKSFSRTLLKMGFPPPTFDQVKSAVGGASEATMSKLIGPDRAAEAGKILRPIFEQEMLNGLIALPHVIHGLKAITNHGILCAVLTNKHGPHARTACDHLGLSKFLKFSLGANDTEWKKPNPELTRLALSRIGFGSDETIFVGDSPYDFDTSINAGLSCHLVATGTHSFEELSKLGAKTTHLNFKELVNHIVPSAIK